MDKQTFAGAGADGFVSAGFLSAFSLTGYDFLFVVAFLLGFITFPVLARIREAGDTDTETVLNELTRQTRENLRVLGAVPGGGFVSHLPLTTRYVPRVSGLDIAVGVTAYQISAATKSLFDATARGGETARGVRHQVTSAVETASKGARGVSAQGAHIAFGVANGAVHAIAEAGTGTTRQFRTVLGTAITATHEVVGNPREALAGAVKGAVTGTIETSYTYTDLPSTIIGQARAVAQDLGVSEEEAVQVAAQATIDAMAGLPADEQAEAWDAILQELANENERRQPEHSNHVSESTKPPAIP